jgi:S1-C subfamily serine protease
MMGGMDESPWQPWDPEPYGPPPPPPPPSRLRAAVALLAIVVVIVSAIGLVAILPSVLHRNNNQGFLGSFFSSGGGPLDTSAISGRVSPALVDITSRFPDGLAAGTGMVITGSGQVLTNNHVIDGADSIQAQVGGTGPVYSARVVGTDANADIALLQLDNASGLATVSIGDSSSVKVGDPVVAIGNALGREGPPSASQGLVTALDQTITASDQGGQSSETLTGLIQVDADVVPGDSGGPLVDGAGKVIGMDTAASDRGFRFRSGASAGFAIPITTAMSVARGLRNGGGGRSTPLPAAKALLGVELSNGADGSGAAVITIQAGSPADIAGINGGDVIVSVDGSEVRSAAELRAVIRSHRPGDMVVVGWVDASDQPHSASVRLISATG